MVKKSKIARSMEFYQDALFFVLSFLRHSRKVDVLCGKITCAKAVAAEPQQKIACKNALWYINDSPAKKMKFMRNLLPSTTYLSSWKKWRADRRSNTCLPEPEPLVFFLSLEAHRTKHLGEVPLWISRRFLGIKVERLPFPGTFSEFSQNFLNNIDRYFGFVWPLSQNILFDDNRKYMYNFLKNGTLKSEISVKFLTFSCCMWCSKPPTDSQVIFGSMIIGSMSAWSRQSTTRFSMIFPRIIT